MSRSIRICSRVTVAWVLLCALWLSPAHAQTWGSAATYVNITKASVQQLSNAVRIILEADGALDTDVDFEQFWAYDEVTTWWEQRDLKRFSMNLLNARTQIGRFVDVGKYPASHVSLSVPAAAREGVGLEVSLFLYIPARIGKVQVPWGGVRDWSQSNVPIRVDMVLSDDKRQLILTVHMERHFDQSTDGATKPDRDGSDLSLESSADKCVLRASHVPLEELASELSKASGLHVLVSPGIDTRITAVLPPMSPPELIKTICNVTGLTLTVQGDTYVITPGVATDIDSYWTVGMRQLELENVSVDDALTMLPPFILRHVKVNTDTNTLTAFGSKQLLDKIGSDLDVIDKSGHQVRLQMMVVQIRDDKSLTRLMDALFEDGNTTTTLKPSDGTIRIGVVDQSLNRVRLTMQSLEHTGALVSDVRPEVVVTSGDEARLFVGKQQFYRFLSPTDSGNELELRKVDVGIELKAQPWTGDGLTVTVPFEISADYIAGRDAAGLPIVSRQRASGSLRVGSGDCIIVGGLRTRDRFREDRRLHPLDKIPSLGALLKEKSRDKSDNAVVVFLSASAVDTLPVSEALAKKSGLLDKAPAPPSG